jgi:hypothetical protein
MADVEQVCLLVATPAVTPVYGVAERVQAQQCGRCMSGQNLNSASLPTLLDYPPPEGVLGKFGKSILYLLVGLSRPVGLFTAYAGAVALGWISESFCVVLVAALAADVVTLRGLFPAFHCFPQCLGYQNVVCTLR